MFGSLKPGLLLQRAVTHTCIILHSSCIDGCVSVFLLPIRWICESNVSMNSSTEILDLIRGGWVNGSGKGVALCVNYCPRAASSTAFFSPSYSSTYMDTDQSSQPSQKVHYSNHLVIILALLSCVWVHCFRINTWFGVKIIWFMCEGLAVNNFWSLFSHIIYLFCTANILY